MVPDSAPQSSDFDEHLCRWRFLMRRRRNPWARAVRTFPSYVGSNTAVFLRNPPPSDFGLIRRPSSRSSVGLAPTCTTSIPRGRPPAHPHARPALGRPVPLHGALHGGGAAIRALGALLALLGRLVGPIEELAHPVRAPAIGVEFAPRMVRNRSNFCGLWDLFGRSWRCRPNVAHIQPNSSRCLAISTNVAASGQDSVQTGQVRFCAGCGANRSNSAEFGQHSFDSGPTSLESD